MKKLHNINNQFEIYTYDMLVDAESLANALFPFIPLGDYELRIEVSKNGFNAKYIGVRIYEDIPDSTIDKVIYADSIRNDSVTSHTLDNFKIGKYYRHEQNKQFKLYFDIITDWIYTTGTYPHIYINFLKKLNP